MSSDLLCLSQAPEKISLDRGVSIATISSLFKSQDGKAHLVAIFAILMLSLSLTLVYAENSTSEPDPASDSVESQTPEESREVTPENEESEPEEKETPPSTPEENEPKQESPKEPESPGESDPEIPEETPPEENNSKPPETSPEESPGENVSQPPETNSTEPENPEETNETQGNSSIPEIELPGNSSEPENLTDFNSSYDMNTTVPENGSIDANFTNGSDFVPEPRQEKPDLSLDITGEDSLTRGRSATFEAILANDGGMAENVSIKWIVPEDFTIISEDNVYCGSLGKGDNCTSTIEVQTSLETSLGGMEINAEASYT